MVPNQRWVKFYCKILENVDLMNDDTAYIVFTKLLLMANSKGEISITTRGLSKQLNMSSSTLYKTLKRLEDYQMSKRLSKHRYTLIVICNWSKYQSTGKQFGAHAVNTRETRGKRTTEVPRIENKNKNSGYEKFRKAREEFSRRKDI